MQAGGQGFESLILHVFKPEGSFCEETEGRIDRNKFIDILTDYEKTSSKKETFVESASF